MAIIVEDGSGIENANSYVSKEDMVAFLAARNLEIEADNQSASLFLAMSILEAESFKGSKEESSQALSFPRSQITDKEGNDIAENTIPSSVVNALCFLAYYLDQDEDFIGQAEPAVKERMIDILKVKFAVGEDLVAQKNNIKSLPLVYNQIKHLLKNSSSNSGRTIRG